MAIRLPDDHPYASLSAPAQREAKAPRIGIINIMPRAETYERSLLLPLARASTLVVPVFVRLVSHGYESTDHTHLDRYYRSWEALTREGPLDGLILTGAPVEEKPFGEVRYWDELHAILKEARVHVRATLGLCWGALALGRVLGIEKRVFKKKLFGVYEEDVLVPDHDILNASSTRASGSASQRTFRCAHSRHSGIAVDELEGAARDGVVRVLSRGELTGPSVFETPDLRFLAHAGHPEYVGERLAFEWNRDKNLGRADVDPPANFDADAPDTTWLDHQDAVFSGLIHRAEAPPMPRER
jgi:homoserine O-succinyltransferase